jgi:phage terminase small subunit
MTDMEKPDLRVVASVPADKSGQPDGAEADAGPDDEACLSPKEIRFCDALAAGETSCQAAKLAGITDRTGRRWRQRPEIQTAVRARLNDSLGAARAILACGAARAATGLVSMSDGSEEASAPRVSAARAVVEGATRLVEIEEIESRLAEVEAQLTSNGGTKRWT